MKCWPLGDPCAWTTATCAVTCWPFWFWSFGDDVRDSATKIWESLESDDSKGTTSIKLTLPDGAVWSIIFFCWQNCNYAKWRLLCRSILTWLRFTWCKPTGVICVVRWLSDNVLTVFVDVLMLDSSSFDTDVTVMKFLVVANRVAIIHTRISYTTCLRKKQRPNKTFLVITRTIRSGFSKLLVTNDFRETSSTQNAAKKWLSIKQTEK